MACFIAACLRFKRPDNCTFFLHFQRNFLWPIFHSKELIQTPIERQRRTIRGLPTGERRGAKAPSGKTTVSQVANCPNAMKKIRALNVRSVRYDCLFWSEARPPLSLPFPPLCGGPALLARCLNHYEIGDGCLKKNRLLQALKFDKRWLKYTVRMEDCTYLCFKDDYRVCVKKRNFYRPPSAARM